jgi:hypothetical protein
MNIFSKPKAVRSTPFSDFFKNGSSEQKKRVYAEVLVRATERQKATMKAAASAQ